ncbi:hypothetical protein [Rhodopseudomonas sp. WA056]|uniref:hypothetical protein n=1 Tax=Rhodopseudomonas sp. WA056 TaxID=2269367 RepID=UPI0013E0D9F5|nr:hypothetical protein [Rhodopseudomonas sp. WA056]
MSAYGDFLQAAEKLSQSNCEAVAPSCLLDFVAQSSHPINDLCDGDRANLLFGAFYRDFAILQRARAPGPPFEPDDISRCAGLLCWLKNQLAGWQVQTDPQRRLFTAIVVSAQALDIEHELWPRLAGSFGRKLEIAEEFGRVISSLAIEFTTRGSMPAPLWEQEAVEKLKEAEAAADWGAIGDCWQPFASQFFPNVLLTQSVRSLSHFWRDCLVSATDTIHHIASAMLLAQVLPTDQRLVLGFASNNPFIEFATVYVTLCGRSAMRTLSSSDASALTAILLKVSNDCARWKGWMKVFNAYPLRFPALQASLGNCLAAASSDAIYAYVHAIVLFPGHSSDDAGRRSVAECLRVFRTAASAQRRTELWTIAHERWKGWRFDDGNSNSHLFDVNYSVLDYAIIGYANECMDQAERDSIMNKIRWELGHLDDKWHGSITDVITAWNRLLSTFQPYARATTIQSTGGDWLNEGQKYLPYDPAKDRYVAMRYRSF